MQGKLDPCIQVCWNQQGPWCAKGYYVNKFCLFIKSLEKFQNRLKYIKLNLVGNNKDWQRHVRLQARGPLSDRDENTFMTY